MQKHRDLYRPKYQYRSFHSLYNNHYSTDKMGRPRAAEGPPLKILFYEFLSGILIFSATIFSGIASFKDAIRGRPYRLHN